MEVKKRALIIGINGQIGSYLCEILHDYQVYGLIRTIPANPVMYVTYVVCDLSDETKLKNIIRNINPDEIYNMAAQSDAVISIAEPEYTMWVNANIVVTLCEIVKELGIKLFQASSMELYKGLDRETINEKGLEFYPKNPYAIAKLAAFWTVKYYRDQLGCYVSSGIISNAESPRRNIKYVTRKIAAGVRKTLTDPNYVIKIGNINAERDWIHAYDVAMAAWLSLQQSTPGDYVISLGTNHTVREFLERSFRKADINLIWKGLRDSIEEIGIDRDTERVLVTVDPSLFRTYEIAQKKTAIGDNTKLKSIGWKPKYDIDDIIVELLKCE